MDQLATGYQNKFIYRFHKTNNGFSEERFIYQNPGWYYLLVQRIPAVLLMEKWISDTKKTLHSHHFIEKEKFRKCLSGILSIDNDDADL